jgi:hypothetical protein
MKHPITLRKIPTASRLQTMKRRARKNRTFVQLLLSEARDFIPTGERGTRSIYDVRGDHLLGHRVDRVIVRMTDGTRKVLQDRFPGGIA